MLKTVHWIEKREVSAGDPTNGVAMGEQLRDWQQGRKNQRLRWACLVFRKSRVAATNNNEGYRFHLVPSAAVHTICCYPSNHTIHSPPFFLKSYQRPTPLPWPTTTTTTTASQQTRVHRSPYVQAFKNYSSQQLTLSHTILRPL